MIFAANDMGDVMINIIDDRGQGIEVGAILAHQDRVGQMIRHDMRLPADKIVEGDIATAELKAPMRFAPARLQGCALLIAQF